MLRLFQVAALVMVGLALSGGALQAQQDSAGEFSFTSVTSATNAVYRMDAVEAELASLRSELASFQEGCEGGGCCDCNGPAWLAGYELTVLRPFVSSDLANYLGAPGFSDDYGTGHRFTLGRDFGSDIGVRFRYWTFDQDHELNPPGANPLAIELDVLDAEMTFNERLWNWEVLVSGGLRYGRHAYSLGDNSVYFEGFGPTVSLEARHKVGCGGLYAIGNFRSSLLAGDIRDPGGLIAAPLVGSTIEDEITVILESQLGMGWYRATGIGDLHLRAVWETQFWLNDTFANDIVTPAGGLATNLGLMGAAFTVELRR